MAYCIPDSGVNPRTLDVCQLNEFEWTSGCEIASSIEVKVNTVKDTEPRCISGRMFWTSTYIFSVSSKDESLVGVRVTASLLNATTLDCVDKLNLKGKGLNRSCLLRRNDNEVSGTLHLKFGTHTQKENCEFRLMLSFESQMEYFEIFSPVFEVLARRPPGEEYMTRRSRANMLFRQQHLGKLREKYTKNPMLLSSEERIEVLNDVMDDISSLPPERMMNLIEMFMKRWRMLIR